MHGHDSARPPRRAASRRRRFGMLAAAALAAVGAALGVSFTADTGFTQVTVSGTSPSKLVFTSQADLPTATQDITFRVSQLEGAVDPTIPTPASFSPVANAAGTVSSKGDIALIDARTSSAQAPYENVQIYLANLKQLQAAYTQFAWPIRLYEGQFDDGGTPNSPTGDHMYWDTTNTLLAASQHLYLTNTGGYLSFRIPTKGNNVLGNIIEVQLGEDATVNPDTDTGDGGSYYTVCTSSCSGGTISPTFYVSVTPSP